MSTDKVEIKPDETNISLEEQAKQQEQNNSVIAKSETGVETKVNENLTDSSEDRPDWLPKKFANAEDLAKAYSELEKKMSAPKEEVKTKQVQQPSENSSLQKYFDEYASSSELSDKSYQELSKMGLSKELVNDYIEGQKAVADREVRAIQEVVGGADNYGKVIDWAKNNLSQEEAEAFNATLDTGTTGQVKLAVAAIAARAGISKEAKSQMIEADTGSVELDSFKSVAQVTKAMNDPRYQTDPAYRKVENKLARSSMI